MDTLTRRFDPKHLFLSWRSSDFCWLLLIITLDIIFLMFSVKN